MEIVLTSMAVLLALIFTLNANPLFTIPTWILVSMFIGGASPIEALPVIAVAVAVSAAGRYVLARYTGHLSDRFVPHKHRRNLRFLDRFLSDEKGLVWPFSVSFLYALSPLPTNALFMLAGAGRVRLMSMLSGFFLGEFLSNVAYMSVISVSFSLENCLLFGLFGIAITLSIFLVDWKKVIRSLIEREKKRRALSTM